MDLCAEQRSVGCLGIEGISLREPVLEGARSRCIDRRCRHVTRGKLRGSIVSPRCVGEFRAGFARTLDGDRRMLVRQVEELTRDPDDDRIRCVETQEPDAGFAVVLDIEPEVEFRKGRNPREVWKGSSHHPGHSKRNDTDPRRPLELLNFERRRNEMSEGARGYGPMRKEQISPRLSPCPRRRRDWPGSMTLFCERRVRAHPIGDVRLKYRVSAR